MGFFNTMHNCIGKDIYTRSLNQTFEISSFDEQEIFSKNFSFAFIALHGVGGEDGKIQSILSKRGIRYTGSGSESCNLTFDKSITKKFLKKMVLKHLYMKLCPTKIP